MACALRGAAAFQSEKLWSPRGGVARANEGCERDRTQVCTVLQSPRAVGWGEGVAKQVSEKVLH